MLDVYYYEVAPRIIVRPGQGTFTYSSDKKLAIGQIAIVSVGKKQIIAVVMSETSKPAYEVKPIVELLDLPPLPQQLLKTVQWMSDYYATHLALCLQAIMPSKPNQPRRARKEAARSIIRKRTNIVFTNDQAQALASIDSMPNGTSLLHGVTGSGKTAVYIESVRKTIEKNNSAIILVPEIALTSQLIAEFENHFSDIIVTHSKMTEAARHHVWLQSINNTKPLVVIGPRSALFLPLPRIGLIIIDEAHEPSFKQEQSPRYSALRVAHTLAEAHQAKLILGSATPGVSDYFYAEKLDRPILSMPTPARADTVKPDVTLVDMTKRTRFTKHRFLSDDLINALSTGLEQKEQSLLFHNRRGTASTTLCEHCGWQAGCARCYVPLTLHADTYQMTCHICGSSSRVPSSCPQCAHTDIIHKGIGTKLVEQEVRKLFPNANIARFDGDSAQSETVERRYQDLYDGNIDIIIGTQVIAKGLDLPHLRTVGIIQADAGLSLPDYTSAERTFQLLAQVIGRVGRSHHSTRVIVQSYQPNHPAVVDGIAQNYHDFYKRTLALRKHTSFPPFTHLLKLTCTYKTEAAAIKNSKSLAAKLRQNVNNIEILGPTPAFYERVRDSYRWQLVIKSSQRDQLIACLSQLPNNPHWQFELDPISLL